MIIRDFQEMNDYGDFDTFGYDDYLTIEKIEDNEDAITFARFMLI
jgi:hypothetical protein